MENYSTLSRDRTFRIRSFSVVLFVIIALVGLYGIIFASQNYFGGSETSGASGSSYATISTGNRAWSELLSSNGIEITRDRGRITLPETIDSDKYGTAFTSLTLTRKTHTVVLLGGALPSDEVEELRNFVRNGGRVITDNPLVLDDLLGSRAEVFAEGATTLLPSNTDVSGMEGIEEIEGSGAGSITFTPDRRSVSLLEANPRPASDFDKDNFTITSNAAIFRLEAGDVISLVDTGIVSNEGLARKDNALFSLRIAGSKSSDVTFIEGIHGYDDARGFAGWPLAWRIATVGFFIAFVVYGCAQGRRFGVGEEPNRDLGPRRVYFAKAVAQALKKSKG